MRRLDKPVPAARWVGAGLREVPQKLPQGLFHDVRALIASFGQGPQLADTDANTETQAIIIIIFPSPRAGGFGL